MKPLDMRDISMIDALPVYNCEKVILNIGCGKGRIDFHLGAMGYRIYATEIKRYDTWKDEKNLTFHISDIFDISSFPVRSAPVVICSQVLEHLADYRKALSNLLELTEIRLIITTPYRTSFNSPGHCNYWDDVASASFKDVHEFVELCHPYMVSISKIRTKAEDVRISQYDYLIIVDKRQNLNSARRLF